jgi:hypothetical protein
MKEEIKIGECIVTALLSLFMLFLCLVLLAERSSAQSGDVFVAACGGQQSCTLATGVPWSVGTQVWRFTARDPNESIRIWIRNNNPTSAHTSQTINVFLTDETVNSLNSNADRWLQAAVTDNTIVGAQCKNLAISNPSGAPGANGKGTCYVPGMYAIQVAVQITGAATQAGSPDTFDIGIVQEIGYPSGAQPGTDTSTQDFGALLNKNSSINTTGSANGAILNCVFNLLQAICIPAFLPVMETGGIAASKQSMNDLSSAFINQTTGAGILGVGNFIFDGTAVPFVQPRAQSAASALASVNSTGTTLSGVQITTSPAGWAQAVQNTATNCSNSIAATATTQHCATGVSVCLVATIAQAQLFANLRDGATGAGTVKWNAALADTAGLGTCIVHEFAAGPICGTINTAMTLELSGATGAGNACTTSIKGYDVK